MSLTKWRVQKNVFSRLLQRTWSQGGTCQSRVGVVITCQEEALTNSILSTPGAASGRYVLALQIFTLLPWQFMWPSHVKRLRIWLYLPRQLEKMRHLDQYQDSPDNTWRMDQKVNLTKGLVPRWQPPKLTNPSAAKWNTDSTWICVYSFSHWTDVL